MIGIYTVRRCSRDLTCYQTLRTLSSKKALALAASNLQSYGHGSMIYRFGKLWALVGPLGHQTEGPASFDTTNAT